MNRIRCFLVEPTGRAQISLRRYADREDSACSVGSYHNATNPIDERNVVLTETGSIASISTDRADPRWPSKCEKCDYAFTDSDPWQTNQEQIYADVADPERRWPHRDLPAGAMFYPSWMQPDSRRGLKAEASTGPKHWQPGPDGKILMVITPGGEWIVDSRASNCGKPTDNEHRCWVRHGEAPNITVDKNGLTCSAGAGSIQCGKYHGFLRGGYLEEC